MRNLHANSHLGRHTSLSMPFWFLVFVCEAPGAAGASLFCWTSSFFPAPLLPKAVSVGSCNCLLRAVNACNLLLLGFLAGLTGPGRDPSRAMSPVPFCLQDGSNELCSSFSWPSHKWSQKLSFWIACRWGDWIISNAIENKFITDGIIIWQMLFPAARPVKRTLLAFQRVIFI